MNPQEAFLELLLAAMKDAALEGKLTQLQTQIDPTQTGKGKLHLVRLIVVPERMQWTAPPGAPFGTPLEGN